MPEGGLRGGVKCSFARCCFVVVGGGGGSGHFVIAGGGGSGHFVIAFYIYLGSIYIYIYGAEIFVKVIDTPRIRLGQVSPFYRRKRSRP